MPSIRSVGQKQVIVMMRVEFLAKIDGAMARLGYNDRASLIREAVYKLLEEERVNVVPEDKTAPGRAGKGGQPKKKVTGVGKAKGGRPDKSVRGGGVIKELLKGNSVRIEDLTERVRGEIEKLTRRTESEHELRELLQSNLRRAEEFTTTGDLETEDRRQEAEADDE